MPSSAEDKANASDPPGAVHKDPRRWALTAAALACGLVLGWQGGWLGALGTAAALTVGLGLPWLRRQHAVQSEDPQAPADDEPRVSGGRVGAEVMVSQVVPVWGKQLDITRDAAADGLSKLLESFVAVAGALGSLGENLDNFTPTVEAGAVDDALAGANPALAALLAPSQRAFDQRNAAMAELSLCARALDELRQAGQRASEIGKHTRLVAFNASIEAQRGSSSSGTNGAVAVALETRALAERMAEVGEQIGHIIRRLDRTVGPETRLGEISDTTPDELQQELALRAREALNGLLGAMGSALQGSAEIKAASKELRNQVDELFVHFQFGDRLAQMLSIVSTDMANFARWVSAHPYASQSDAAEWLTNLEASYTMEEQRSQHHGNVHIDRGSEIEFF